MLWAPGVFAGGGVTTGGGGLRPIPFWLFAGVKAISDRLKQEVPLLSERFS